MKVFLLLVILLFSLMAYPETRVYEAMVSFKGELLFIEKHADTYEEGEITKSLIEYYDTAGVQIGEYQSNFKVSLAVPQHLLVDKRNNLKHGLSYKDGKVQVFWEENGKISKEVAKKEKLIQDKDVFTVQGLHYFILSNLKNAESLHNKKISLVVPGKIDTSDYKIRILFENDKKVEIELKRDSWLLGFLSPRMKFIYDRKNKKLIAYEGVYSLKEKNGEVINVDVIYKYPKNSSF